MIILILRIIFNYVHNFILSLPKLGKRINTDCEECT